MKPTPKPLPINSSSPAGLLLLTAIRGERMRLELENARHEYGNKGRTGPLTNKRPRSQRTEEY